jgi:hypothetical protein
VKSSSFTIAMLNVLRKPRSVLFNVSLIGIIAGPAPSVPAMVVARSWEIVPITSPVLAIFWETSRLGSTTWTCARVSGNCVGPRP